MECTPIKVFLLVVLCLQNAGYTLWRRYSVGVLKETYSASSVLLAGELIKLAWSSVVTLLDKSASSAQGSGPYKLAWLVRHSLPMSVPAVIFWAMNLLSYVSLQRIDASTFTVCAQMKILTTALFSALILGRQLHSRKWRALALLVCGVVLVSNGMSVHDAAPAKAADHGPAVISTWEGMVLPGFADRMIGLAAVLLEVTLSGFSAVYFEKVLKSKTVTLSVWDRNFQLALYSIVLYAPVCATAETGFTGGWTLSACGLAIMGAGGGILVALTVKYTDSIMKTFATSGAIVVCALFSYMFLGGVLDVPIAVGAGCAILAIANYNDEGGGLVPDTVRLPALVPPSDKGELEVGLPQRLGRTTSTVLTESHWLARRTAPVSTTGSAAV